MNEAREGQLAVEVACRCEQATLVRADMVDDWTCGKCRRSGERTGRTVVLGVDGSLAYTNALGALRTAGYIEGTSVVRITTGGLAAITWTVEPIGDLFDHWRNHPKIDRAGRLILDALRDVYPEGYELAQLAEVCEYHERTKAFTNQLGRLRTLDLVTGARISPIRLTDDFAEAIA